MRARRKQLAWFQLGLTNRVRQQEFLTIFPKYRKFQPKAAQNLLSRKFPKNRICFDIPPSFFCACKITASSLSESSGFILMKRPTFTPVPVAAGRAEEVRRVIAISLNFLFIIKHALWSFACLSYGAPSPLFILSPVSPEEIHRNFRCLHRKGLLGRKLL